jgi:hypothetical protein
MINIHVHKAGKHWYMLQPPTYEDKQASCA